MGVYMDSTPLVCRIISSLAAYAFWLQHEHVNPDSSSLSEVRREGWFEKRVSRLKELINIMALPKDGVSAEVRRIYERQLVCGRVCKEDNMDLEFLVREE